MSIFIFFFSFSLYVLECLGPDLPGTFLVSVEPHFANHTSTSTTTQSPKRDGIEVKDFSLEPRFEVASLDEQDDLRRALEPMARPRIEVLDIPASAAAAAAETARAEAAKLAAAAAGEEDPAAAPEEEGDEGGKEEEEITFGGAGDATGPSRTLRARLYLPPHLRKSDHLKYPLVVHVYSGPGHQLVRDEWRAADFNWVMATGLGFVVLEVDGAGSGGRGQSLAAMVKGRLGGPEVCEGC